MPASRRPLSPHLQIYKWQVQMVTSILHRATGIALAVGTLLLAWALVALAQGDAAYARFKAVIGSPLGIVLLVGWSWSLFFHLCNGIRHLLQDAGLGYAVAQFVRSSWLAVVGSVVLLVLVWGYVLMAGGGV